MGLRIDISAVSQAAWRHAAGREASGSARSAGEELLPAGNEPEVRDWETPLRAGFGEGTVSIPGTTLRAINRNLQDARRIVPSAEELRWETAARVREERERIEAEASQRVAEAEAAARQRAPAPQAGESPVQAVRPRPVKEEVAPAPRRVRPEPAPQARTFQDQAEAVLHIRNAQPSLTPPPELVSEVTQTPARLDVLA
ncbi:MAG: hypothetical protein KA184_18315 [Candidatus Hydrogenedentes bacterium]|nr:hypothetical protein [Candidatus Hydrogenedentota bacterium]